MNVNKFNNIKVQTKGWVKYRFPEKKRQTDVWGGRGLDD